MNYDDFHALEKIAGHLRAAQRRIAAQAGLPMVHYEILDCLARAGAAGNTPLAVAQHLGMTKGTVSQSISLLAARGYLTKAPDARDGRVQRLTLTDRSRGLLGAAYEALQAACGPIDLDHAYGRIFLTILRDVARQMGERDADSPAALPARRGVAG